MIKHTQTQVSNLTLTAYDIYKVAKSLGIEVEDVITSNCVVRIDKESKLPAFWVRRDKADSFAEILKQANEKVIDEGDAANDAWEDAVSRISPIIQKKCERMKVEFEMDEEQQLLCGSFSAFLGLLYLALDTSEPFSEQLRRNTEIFLEPHADDQ